MLDFIDWSTVELTACYGSMIASCTSIYQTCKAWKYDQNEMAVDETVANLLPSDHPHKKMLIGGVYDKSQNKIIDGEIEYNISELSNMRYINTFDPTKIKTHSAHIFKTKYILSSSVQNSKTGYILTANVRPLNIRQMAHHNPIQVVTLCREKTILHTNRAMKSIALNLTCIAVAYYAGHIQWKNYKKECEQFDSKNPDESIAQFLHDDFLNRYKKS